MRQSRQFRTSLFFLRENLTQPKAQKALKALKAQKV